MAQLSIHAGHAPAGMKGCGAVGYLNESVENRKVVEAVKKLIEIEDFSALIGNSPAKILKYLVDDINSYNKPAISVHLNAFNGAANGTRVYISSKTNSNDKKWAEGLGKSIADACGIKWGGVFVNDKLYLFKHCKKPVYILECCFVDSAVDSEKWDAEKAGKAIADYLVKTKNAAYKDKENEDYKEDGGDIVESEVKYYVQAGAFKSKQNAEFCLRRLEADGFEGCFIKEVNK